LKLKVYRLENEVSALKQEIKVSIVIWNTWRGHEVNIWRGNKKIKLSEKVKNFLLKFSIFQKGAVL
jgi:hypothetical protein